MLVDLGWDDDRARRVGDLVRATAAHGAAADDDTAVLLDADLAVLGSDPAAYQAYVTGVRTEYGHVDAAGGRSGGVRSCATCWPATPSTRPNRAAAGGLAAPPPT